MKRHPSLIPLSHQHQHGLALTVGIDRSEPSQAERLREDVLRLWEIEIRGHFDVEERILFPAVRERIETPPLVDELVEQHRRIERLVAELAAAPVEEADKRLRALGETLTTHIRAEERRLFEQIQQALPAAELEELGERLEAELVRVCPQSSGERA